MRKRPPTRSDTTIRRQADAKIGRWFAVAIAVHVAWVGLWWAFRREDRPPTSAVHYQPLKRPNARAALAQARQKMRQQQQQQAPKPPKPVKETEATGQIVDIPPSADPRPPDQADYLAEHNARTEHETRSRHASPDHPTVAHEASKSGRTELSASAPSLPPPQTQQAEAQTDSTASAPSGATQDRTAQTAKDKLALHLDPTLGHFKNQDAQTWVDKQQRQGPAAAAVPQPQGASAPGSTAGKGLTLADLMPNPEALARISGGPTNDALSDVDVGEGTFLNAREYKYAAFFNRVKHNVAQFWRPLGEYQRRDPTGNVYGYRSRMTTLEIVLDGEGNLSDVHLQQSSGVDFLDKEAINAFQKAAPFPNPPKGLIGPSGTVHFEFGFLLDMQQRGFFQTPY